MSGPTRLTFSLILSFLSAPVLAEPPAVNFNRDIRPILSRNCFACHGADEGSRKGELRLDQREAALQSGVVVAGKPEESELVARIFADDPELVMPPVKSGHRLSAEEKQLLRNWVTAGAPYEVHWSFVAPVKSPPPAVKQTAWPRHPLDQFILAKLETRQLAPEREADRYQWIRRVSLDLTGLPPTPEEAEAFVDDASENAYEKVVDRLLTSEAYGEHWARLWLDLARYADTKGYEKDLPREIWRYRDWVIEALNRDLPFDQFTAEQLAGDLLPDATPAQQVATAFHRNTMSNDEGGTDNEEFRVAAVKDRVDTTMQVWMGLTMGCAKCHSHKYDPVSQRDYYAFYAIFNQTEDADRPDDSPLLSLPTPEQSAQLAELEAKVKSLEAAKASKEEIEAARKTLNDARAGLAKIPVLRELAADRQRKTQIHNRGNFLDQGEPVSPAVPELFGAWPEQAPKNRLGLARWLMQPENPLTARVMVNRLWARLFGTGLVETEEDFGTQGLLPTHPELLDWLAVDFREQGWSLKRLLRTLVLSSTYRQSSVVTAEKLEADPRNRLLSRGPRIRLEAEAIRDQALAAAGLLTRQLGGPSVMPPQPDGLWKSTYSGLKWVNATGPNRYRRGIYIYRKRTSPYPSMITFDAGSGEVCQIRRDRTNTPLQALVTLNDPAFLEAAGALSRRMLEIEGPLSAQLERGFRLTLVRPPAPEEIARLAALYESLQEDYRQDAQAAQKLLAAADLKTGDAALVAVANVLLNLDETLTRP